MEPPASVIDVAEITVADGIKPLFRDADARGWRAVAILKPRGVRFWCPCPRGHNMWLEPNPVDEHYETTIRARLSNKTCWEEATTS